MDKLPLVTRSILADKIDALREAFPEVFSEDDKVDFAKLRQALGDFAEVGPERYSFTWASKSEAIQNLQAPSVGTLLPVPEASVSWDKTHNLIIEGDNLEVLKLLQDSYHNSVKMIYIDPPYNTGNEFIYPDNFREGLDDYLRYSGQVDDEGFRVSTNTETNGRFHSKWLNMIYPRLFLAKNLLRPDGVLFVSIDDNEMATLRLVLNEIFGEENFLANIIWQKAFSPRNNAPTFSVSHDYILCYAKDANRCTIRRLPTTSEQRARYTNRDNDPRGDWTDSDLTVSLTSGQRGRSYQRSGTGANIYVVRAPSGREIYPPAGRCWLYPEEKFRELDADGRIWWGESGSNVPRLKRFFAEIQGGLIPETIWSFQEVGHNQEASQELKDIFSDVSDAAFPTPKPTRLMKRLLELATCNTSNDIVLDFFAGSGTMGHAVVAKNAEDGGQRQFILVQLPEPLARPLGLSTRRLKTISDITIERLRRVVHDVASFDSGFKVFKLSSSNFAVWDATVSAEEIGRQLNMVVNNVMPGRRSDDLLFEILLKTGYSLTANIETVVIEAGGGQVPVYLIEDGALAICLAEDLTISSIRVLAELEPRHVICKDSAFHGNDAAKVNAKLELEGRGIQFETV